MQWRRDCRTVALSPGVPAIVAGDISGALRRSPFWPVRREVHRHHRACFPQWGQVRGANAGHMGDMCRIGKGFRRNGAQGSYAAGVRPRPHNRQADAPWARASSTRWSESGVDAIRTTPDYGRSGGSGKHVSTVSCGVPSRSHIGARLNPAVPVVSVVLPVSALPHAELGETVDQLDGVDVFRLLVAQRPLDADADRRAIGDR